MFEHDSPEFSVAVERIKSYMSILSKNPIDTHDDEVIHKTLEAAAVILPSKFTSAFFF